MLRATILTLIGVLAALAVATQSQTQETRVPGDAGEVRLSYAPVVKAVTPSVVNIYAKRVVETRVSPFAGDPFFSQFFGGFETRPRIQNSLGSGVILGSQGIVVSNFHVVGNATDIRVVLADRREFDAEVVLSDAETDLAVMRLLDAPALPGLDFADSDAVEVGDLVLAVGNPFGVGQTVSSGIVSAAARSGRVGGKPGYFIQTDAPINPGNSGGALVDMSGRLVGINSAILTRSGGSNGIGFAIPANLVAQYVAHAEAGETELRRPWAGVTVQPVDGPLAEALGLEVPRGVLLGALHPASPFAAAGLETGDVIVGVGGRPVDDGPEMLFRLLTLGVGTAADVAYLRGGEERHASVALIEAPDAPARQALRIDSPGILQGLSLANINPAVVAELGLPFDSTGVVVTGVEGPSSRARLQPGDIILGVNGEKIETTADMARVAGSRARAYAIDLLRGSQRALLRIANR